MEYRLDELFDLQMGKTPSRNNPEYWNSKDHKWISIADLSKCGKYISETKEYLSDKAVKESGISVIPANTVIMSFKLSIGKTAITAEPMFSNEAIMSFRDLRKIDLLPDYLYYLFSGKEWDEGTNKAVLGKTLNKATLSQVQIKVHSFSEQKKIVKTLDKVSSIIDSRRRELQALDDLVKARFVEMFGDPNEERIRWNEVSIGDHCFVTKLAGFEYTNYIHYEDSGDVVMVKAQNVKRGSLNEKDLSYISQDVSDSLPRSQLAPGDIVMTYVGANIGDVAIIDDRHKYHLAPNVAKIRPDRREYNPIFFMYMLMMKTDYIMRNSADTAKAALGMERIRRLKVFTPPLGLQNEFSTFVKQVDKSKFVVQQALEKAQLLFDSLMQKYFG